MLLKIQETARLLKCHRELIASLAPLSVVPMPYGCFDYLPVFRR